ncbi:hypothetical protein AVEN_274904-1 [Araneus ventricosus]|uniref:Uncharacterized protein n=1 Tax=Araneus ventricosus TaxID=182803 RepID=A0A4Y2JZK7_ARAVE|nr:hypothetical protein AVEN_274904-1 [Araneus ventricosus]
MTSASEMTSFHASSQANYLCVMTVWAMGSLISVQLRRDIHYSFLIKSSEKVLCVKRHSIHSSSSIRQGVKKALCVDTPLLRFPTVQVATLARPI